jgi:hypothetical protein
MSWLQFLAVNDRVMTSLTRDLRLGHVAWGYGVCSLWFAQDPYLTLLLLSAGMAGMVHSYIKDRDQMTAIGDIFERLDRLSAENEGLRAALRRKASEAADG